VLAAALSLIVTAGVAYARGSLVFALVGAVIFFLRPILRHMRLKRTVYTLTATKLEIRTGILSKDAKSIPLRHIDNVEVSETLKERLIGIGDVLIDSAALDSKMVLDNINNPRKYADLIMDQLQYWN
jgi:putative membrane protein